MALTVLGSTRHIDQILVGLMKAGQAKSQNKSGVHTRYLFPGKENDTSIPDVLLVVA